MGEGRSRLGYPFASTVHSNWSPDSGPKRELPLRKPCTGVDEVAKEARGFSILRKI